MSITPYFPRSWLLDPFDFGPVVPYWLRQPVFNELNVGNAVGRLVDDDKEFAVEVDVSQFNPKELSVNIRNDELVIEGHHEERTDENGKIERHFIRKYTIPKNAQLETMQSNLDDRGVLRVSAHKMGTEGAHSRNIPIRAAPRQSIKPSGATKQK